MDELLHRTPEALRPHVQDWLERTGASFSPGDWSDSGNSGARVFSVVGRMPGDGPHHMIAKILPPRNHAAREPARHIAALADSPQAFASEHLTRFPRGFPPVELPGNAWILFQEIAGGSVREYTPLARPFAAARPAPAWAGEVCRSIVNLVLHGWNPPVDVGVEPMTAAAFLNHLLEDRLSPGGPLDTWAAREPQLIHDPQPRVAIPGMGRHTNPIALALNPALGGDVAIKILTGRCHRDLHPGNLLLRVNDPKDVTAYRLIDLSRYRRPAALAAEPAYLLMSMLASKVGDRTLLTPEQRIALAHLIADPAADGRRVVPLGLCEIVDSIRGASADWADRSGFHDDWKAQWLLSLVGCALIYTGRARLLSAAERDWFFLVAALSADAYLAEFGPEQPVPGPSVLPPRPAYVLPRASVIRALRRQWDRAPELPLIIHGEPGSGKTQLAIEYAQGTRYSNVAWLRANRPESLAPQLIRLARTVNLLPQPDPMAMLPDLFRILSGHGGWLVVFDGVSGIEELEEFLPHLRQKGLDVLVTSRSRRFQELGTPFEMPGLRRPESVRLLRQRVPRLTTGWANEIAEALGDLPLAIDQAADFLDDSVITPADYVALLRAEPTRILAEGELISYPEPIATVWSIALHALEQSAPDAVTLLKVCAGFGPAPIPLSALRGFGLPDDSGGTRLSSALRAASRSGLIAVRQPYAVMNPLLQAFVRHLQPLPDSGPSVRLALSASVPGDPGDPATWPSFAALLPHALALDLTSDEREPCRRLSLTLARYLIYSGNPGTARSLAEAMYIRIQQALDDEADPVLDVMSTLAQAYFQLGDPVQAADLDERILRVRRNILGEDDPRTLQAIHNLAIDLSAAARAHPEDPAAADRARRLHESNVVVRSRVLGDRHPDTMLSVLNLAYDRRLSGDRQDARELSARALAGLTEAKGRDHPHTLHCAHWHALDLAACEQDEEARALLLDTYRRRRAVLGPHHPETLNTALALAAAQRACGHFQAARPLDELALNRLAAGLGPDHPRTLQAAHGFGLDLLGCNETARALARFRDTYQRRSAVLGPRNLETLRSAHGLARALEHAGDQEEAAELHALVRAGLASPAPRVRPQA